ncbi:co-chaperone GroES [Campylobacter canadensis]|uniref:Co-chaperonin GroES n=1 Tax=Campylobacter canadensis TaxID=449520 RepID=A0ABS7WS74_9BACT|nr:co-chaperone GroES [Campylobacter canadensis]MBZ7987610.1 co-chaperone GroES [Campylobacter canadensis]MBZ7994955.1 co-chaperone GroES [Campylobacter canadensis]MBZ7996895.1 co-chaperone GroES [Campylobacter canadensis]MBZ7998744.1 co-chaperone GroES [Campylobacter canadensis]MBZ8000374.1 co-chaperone GroES [Campylobacter canadensis]
MNFTPLNKRVLIKRLEETKTTASGIIIPDNAKEKPQQGEVIAVASEIQDIKKGDKVVFGKYAGSEIKLENENYLILSYEDILGIL